MFSSLFFFRSPPLANPNLKNAESSAAALLLLTRLILRVPINQRGEKLKWFTATSSILPAAAAFIASWKFVSHPTGARLHLDTPSHATDSVVLAGGIRCSSGAPLDKGGGRAVEATVTTPIHPGDAQSFKHWLPPFSRSAAVCFNQWRGMTAGEAKVPAVTFRPASAVTDTPSPNVKHLRLTAV